MHVLRVGESRDACLIVVGKTEGNKPLGRPRRKWGIILKWVLKRIQKYVDCIRVAWDREKWWTVGKTVMNLRSHKIMGIAWLSEDLLVFLKDCAPRTSLVSILYTGSGLKMGRDSSVDIAALYGSQRSGDRIPVGATFSAPVQTGSAAHPASYKMGTGSFLGFKAAGAWR